MVERTEQLMFSNNSVVAMSQEKKGFICLAFCTKMYVQMDWFQIDHTANEKGAFLRLFLSAFPDLMALFILKMGQVHTCFF